jgi:RNA polymerase sigma-70 factor, ECF subfamily
MSSPDLATTLESETAATHLDHYRRHRSLLFAIAYEVTGSVSDSDDVLQEVWTAWSGASLDQVREPRAYLATATTRRAIDALRTRQRRRETYVGQWLPEPTPAPGQLVTLAEDPERAAEIADEVTTGLLVVLESLSPDERACFVLHEAFGLGHAEIGPILGRSHAAVRKLHSRAVERVRSRRPRYAVERDDAVAVAERFLQAAAGGDLAALVTMLSPNAVVISDGGGRVSAAANVVRGPDKVARFFAGLTRTAAARHDLTYQPAVVGGLPALIAWRNGPGGPDGRDEPAGAVADTVVMIEVQDDVVSAVYVQRNPDKLAHLAHSGTREGGRKRPT